MKKYGEITNARKLLGLPERATMMEIKTKYRSLLAEWHPDKCSDNVVERKEITQEIISSYKTIVDYCNHYRYSFTEEEIKNHFSEDEHWLERFGDDPIWGNEHRATPSK
jgi:DnaJ-class molecular chaperone